MNHLFSNYFLLAFRSFNKNRFSVAVSILGMSIAFACAIVAWFNYELNANFDSQHVNAENIYRINFKHQAEQTDYHYGITPIPMGGLIKENFKGSVEVVRYETNDLQVKINDQLFESFCAFADPEFLKVFTINLSAGSADISGNNILISDDIATKYFGSADPVGKSISILVNGNPMEFKVTGIFPAFGFNNSFRFGMLTNLDNFFTTVSDQSFKPDNWKKWNTTFLYFPDASQVSNVTRSLATYIPTQNEARPDLKVDEFYLDSFVGMAARSARCKPVVTGLGNLCRPPPSSFCSWCRLSCY